MIQTLKTQPDVGVVVKKDTPNYIEWEQKGRLDIDCRTWKENAIAPTTTTTPLNKVLICKKHCTNCKNYHSVMWLGFEEPHCRLFGSLFGENLNFKNIYENCSYYEYNDKLLTPYNLNNLRIRKLTPKECGRLMGVKDEDIDKLTLSKSAQYHVFGDSIVVDVLMNIFKQLL